MVFTCLFYREQSKKDPPPHKYHNLLHNFFQK